MFGTIDFAMVVSKPDKTTVRLGRKIVPPKTHGPSHKKGDKVYKYAPAINVTATSAGNWGNRIGLTFTPLDAGPFVQEFSLRVRLAPGIDSSEPQVDEFYKRLSLKEGDPNYAPTLINGISQLITVEARQEYLLVRGSPGDQCRQQVP